MKFNFAGDSLNHRDQIFELVDQPLERYFDLISSRPSFEPVSTQGRGYAARWVIEDGWLFLESITARWSDEETLTVQHLFPFAGTQVFAAWYSGVIRGYQRSKGLPDLSNPQAARYPDMTLHVENGRVDNAIMADNLADSIVAVGDPNASVVDLDEYRRSSVNATWDDVMV